MARAFILAEISNDEVELSLMQIRPPLDDRDCANDTKVSEIVSIDQGQSRRM